MERKIGLETSPTDFSWIYFSKLMLQDSTSNPKQGKAGNNRSAQ